MISNYNLTCDYHNFDLKDRIYLIPQWALKVIYTDGFNEVVYSGNSANVTLLEGHDINFTEESSFDERFRFSKSVSIKVNGYMTFSDLYNRYMAIIETKEGEFYLVNVDFPSYVTHTYTLNNGTNSTELVFSSQSNIATLKLTNFNPNNVNSCKQYSNAKIKDVKLTEAWASYLSTWQKSLVNKGEFVDIEPLPDSISLTEEFDGEKYTVTLGFDIPMSYYKNDWHIKLLQFEENKYRGYISLEDENKAFVGYNVGLFPSYTINGDIISIRLTETAIRGIAYGDDYAIIDTNIPNSIEFSGATCKNYNFESSCDWEVESKPNYITITPMSGNADTQYTLQVCNTDDETGYAVSEFIIKTCNARVRPEVVIKNPIYRYTATTETVCSEITNERWVESGTTCTGTHGVDKWVNSVKLVSYDDGETWFNTGIESATSLIETNSPDCGYAERWVESGTTCVGHDKYTNSYKQVSYDSGSTWTTPQPIQYSATTLIEAYSPDCVPPFDGKYKLTLYNSHIESGECDSYTEMGAGTLRPYYLNTKIAEIGYCVTSIVRTFSGFTSLQHVIIPNNIVNIGKESFYECEMLLNVTIPNSVTSIGSYAFARCKSLTNVTIGTGVTSISSGTFYGCRSLSSITIPDSVTSIGNYAFHDCSGLTSCTIGSGVTSIGDEAFYNCKALLNIDIPDSTTNIGESAFTNCYSLSSVTIGTGITSIGRGAFSSGLSLSSVTILATTPPTLGFLAFYDTNNCPIYVPSGSVNAYKLAHNWSDYSSRIQPIP